MGTMPNDLEKELLALAAAEHRRRETRVARQEEAVRPLSRLFSYHMARGAPSPPEGTRRVMANTPVGEVVVDLPADDPLTRAIERGVDISMSVTTVASRGPNANGDDFSELSTEALSAMFMTREAQAQRDLTGIFEDTGYSEDDPFQVEFSGEFPEGSTQPNEAVRFQVGRQSPPPVTMMNRRAVSMDGQVVSRRGEDGRFRPLQSTGEAIADAYDVREVMADLRRSQDTPLSARPVAPRRQAPAGASGLPLASERCYRPSALERVAGDDMFGDD